MLQEVFDTLGKPFREPMPFPKLLLIIVLYAILVYIAFDATRIVGSYIKSAVD